MSKTPAVQEAPSVPSTYDSALMDMIGDTEGHGNSQAAADNIVPLIYVLQGLSPQVSVRNPNYIEGAGPGDFYLRSSAQPVVSGTEGFLFQPCYSYKEWVEWVPRDKGGGFVTRHDTTVTEAGEDVPADVADAKFVVDPDIRQKVWSRPNGNDLIFTKGVAGFVLGMGAPQPYVIPFSSTGLTVAREWQYRRNTKQVNGKIAGAYCCVYRLKTRMRKNVKGEWYLISVEDANAADGYPEVRREGQLILPAGFVQTREDLERGKNLYTAFAGRVMTAEAPRDDTMVKEEPPF